MTCQFVPRRGARGSGSAPSQLIRLLRQVVGERPRHLVCGAMVDDVTIDESREEVRVHVARQIVPGGARAGGGGAPAPRPRESASPARPRATAGPPPSGGGP